MFHKLKCNLRHLYWESPSNLSEREKNFQDIYVSDDSNNPEYLYYHYYSNHWRWTISRFLTPVFAIDGGTQYVGNVKVHETGQLVQRISYSRYIFACKVYLDDYDDERNDDRILHTYSYGDVLCVAPTPRKIIRIKRRPSGRLEFPTDLDPWLYMSTGFEYGNWQVMSRPYHSDDTINISLVYPRWDCIDDYGERGVFTPVANSGAATRYLGREVYKDQHGNEYRKNGGVFDLIRENANRIYIIGTERIWGQRAREIGWYEGNALPTKTTPATFVKNKFVGTEKTAFPDDTLTLTYNRLEFKGFEEPSYVFNVETWL